jgi:Family of unknown function (DUF6153)
MPTLGGVRTRGSPRPTARNALWIAGLLLTLAGLVAMHGLGGHGIPGVAAHDVGAMVTTTAPAAHPADPAEDQGVHGTAPEQSEHSEHSGLMALCLAVLVTLLVTLVRRLGAGHAGSVPVRRGRPGRSRPQRHGRDRDPPSLTALSIQRC